MGLFTFNLQLVCDPWYWGRSYYGPFRLTAEETGQGMGWDIHDNDYLTGLTYITSNGYGLTVGFGTSRAQALALYQQMCYVSVKMTATDPGTGNTINTSESGIVGDHFGGGWWGFVVTGGDMSNIGQGNPGFPNGADITASLVIHGPGGKTVCPQTASTFVK